MSGEREDYPLPFPFINRMEIDSIAPMDAARPEGRCGQRYWFEFASRGEAEQFQRDLFEFAKHWVPSRPGTQGERRPG